MKNSFNFFNVVREIVLLRIDFCFFEKKVAPFLTLMYYN